MSDIVDRLRASSHQHKDARAIRLEAADEITRLRARVGELEGALEEIDDRCAGEVTALAMDVQGIVRRALP